MVIFFDVDGTICTQKYKDTYEQAKPIAKNIKKVNSLYDKGIKIIIWTARGTTTGINWKELTEKQLKEWGVKYHELRMNKPYYDMFICDKAISSEVFFK